MEIFRLAWVNSLKPISFWGSFSISDREYPQYGAILLPDVIFHPHGIHPTQYYKWSKEFLEAGKKRLNGDIIREATSPEVKELRDENNDLKQVVAELILKTRMLKKSLKGLE